MEEITPPRIEPITDSETGTRDQSAQKARVKPLRTVKPASPIVPEIGAPADVEEQHKLDEMA